MSVGCLLLSHVYDGRVMYRTVVCRLVSEGNAVGGRRLLPSVVS